MTRGNKRLTFNFVDSKPNIVVSGWTFQNNCFHSIILEWRIRMEFSICWSILPTNRGIISYIYNWSTRSFWIRKDQGTKFLENRIKWHFAEKYNIEWVWSLIYISIAWEKYPLFWLTALTCSFSRSTKLISIPILRTFVFQIERLATFRSSKIKPSKFHMKQKFMQTFKHNKCEELIHC